VVSPEGAKKKTPGEGDRESEGFTVRGERTGEIDTQKKKEKKKDWAVGTLYSTSKF